MDKAIKRIVRIWLLSAMCVMSLLGVQINQVLAATSSATFDESPYSATYDETRDSSYNWVDCEVTLNCDEMPGTYSVQLEYDTDHLRYMSGADWSGNGMVLLQGTALDKEVHYTLRFELLTGGKSGLYIKAMEVYAKENLARMETGELPRAEIDITGLNVTGAPDYSFGNSNLPAEVPFIGEVILDGVVYYVVDLEQYVPAEANWSYDKTTSGEGDLAVTYLTNNNGDMYYLYLMDQNGMYTMFARGGDGALYQCVDNQRFFCVSALACRSLPNGLTTDEILAEGILYVQYKDGTHTFACKNDAGIYVERKVPGVNDDKAATDADDLSQEDTAGDVAGSAELGEIGIMQYGMIAAIAVAMVVLFALVLSRSKKKKKRKAAAEAAKAAKAAKHEQQQRQAMYDAYKAEKDLSENINEIMLAETARKEEEIDQRLGEQLEMDESVALDIAEIEHQVENVVIHDDEDNNLDVKEFEEALQQAMKDK